MIVYLIKRPHDAILLSLFPEGDKSKWKPVHPEISGGGRGRKEENSWVDKSTIKFEILCGSPAFVILGPYRKENAVSGDFFPCAVAPPA